MKIDSKFFALALLFCAGTQLSFFSTCDAAPAAKAKTSPAVSSAASKQQKLHRFDFRLEGVSCGRCIVNIRAALRQTKGVKRCEVALRKPYGGVVVYDPALIDVQKLTKITMTADPKTTVAVKDSVDETIPNLPGVLIPKYTSLQKTATQKESG
ncbi:MAG: heavy metal-associated domain-containing protein [Candidatus Obscuribacterales bacterium]|jgi:copper chaperone CopZ